MRILEMKAAEVRSGQRVANRGRIVRINRSEHVVEIWFQGADRYTTFFPENTLRVIDVEVEK